MKNKNSLVQFVLPIHVQNSDIDSFNHVNNAVYLKWMDDCARAHSMNLGIDCNQAKEFGYGMAVRECRVLYLASAYVHEDISVATWIVSNDKKLRITREFEITRDSDRKKLVSAQLGYVCINLQNGRPSKMPDEFQNCYRVI